MNQAGLYISIPFCRQKCTYCNFASDVHPAVLLPSYVESLVKEISTKGNLWAQAGLSCSNTAVDTIYMGGGTPGLLSGAQIQRVLQTLKESFSVADNSEITIEASPENVTPANASAWTASGINRVSLGVQSMIREELRAVGRIYDAVDVTQAFANLRDAGIRNISADLMAGLPHQTAESWVRSLEQVLDLEPDHFSIYMLEVDDDSRLGHELLRKGERYHAGSVSSEEQVADFYLTAMDLLRTLGFDHYEISNFARPGRGARHNEKYWTNAPYFGFGADAHSYDGERRWANTDSAFSYIEMIEKGQPAVVDRRELTPREKLEERFFLGLRRREGVSLARLDAEFAPIFKEGGSVAEKFAASIQQLREAGWLESEGDRVRLTDEGLLFSNEVFAGFMEDELWRMIA